ncbi:hypothetical protein COLO4_08141 [Corchorus olitorius]|uniref:RNase H type-1 domain-containing protein n=1 Tax=Corchorus olitorius TaxID=93759 RepID=A0A1R3KH37_9ROSI|nr:hypothetical protein COLO4_08141 [Corchorus olitorius]
MFGVLSGVLIVQINSKFSYGGAAGMLYQHLWDYIEGICGVRIEKQGITSFDRWLLTVGEKLQGGNDEFFTKLAFVCWTLWKVRCEFIFGKQSISLEGTMIRCQKAIKEFIQNMTNGQMKSNNIGLKQEVQQIWQKPPEDWIKMNVDGSFDMKTRKAGIGVVTRNSNGYVISVISKKVEVPDALTAVALALREAAQHAVGNGWNKVCFETDSSLLYSDFHRSDCRDLNWKVGSIVQDIHLLVYSIEYRKISLISRQANMATDWFAKQSRLEMSYIDWRRYPPSSLVGIWCSDGVPAPH